MLHYSINKLLPDYMARFCLVILLLFAVSCEEKSENIVPFSREENIFNDKKLIISFVVNRHRNYYIDIDFLFSSNEERELAKRIAGDAYTTCDKGKNCGIDFFVKIKIFEKEKLILDRDVETKGTYSFTADKFLRNIIMKTLKPGHYTVELYTEKVSKEINDIKTEISIRSDGRADDLEN